MELLICIDDHGPIKAGDVIVTCADGWEWSKAERENPAWTIVRAPITQVESSALCQRRYSVDATKLKPEMTGAEFRALMRDNQ